MKMIMLALVCSVVIFAADEPKGPKPLTLEEQEQFSRVTIRAQGDQLSFVDAQRTAEASMAAYKAALAELQKSHNAPGCEILANKTWKCPPEAPVLQDANKDK